MLDNNNNNFSLIQIIWVIFFSFFCSFAKKLNEYAKLPKRQRDFLFFISEMTLSGVSGILIGILSMYFSSNLYLSTFSAGVGGILGIKLVKVAVKALLIIKNVDISKLDIDEIDNDDKKEDKK